MWVCSFYKRSRFCRERTLGRNSGGCRTIRLERRLAAGSHRSFLGESRVQLGAPTPYGAPTPHGAPTPQRSRPTLLSCTLAVSSLYSALARRVEISHIWPMGKVIVKIKLTNLFDLGAQHRKLSTAKPREVEAEALVDTGATASISNPASSALSVWKR